MGIFIPIMGTNSKPHDVEAVGIADALFSKVQQRVLALLFGQPTRRFQSAELIRLVAGGTGATQRTLKTLVGSGLVTVTAIGNQRHFQANAASPVFDALHVLVARTVALMDPLRAALVPFQATIHEAFVFGSVARGTERATSDVDLFVVSDTLSYSALYAALAPVEHQLARPVNPILLTLEQWQSRLNDDASFATQVQSGDKIVLLEARDGSGGAGAGDV